MPNIQFGLQLISVLECQGAVCLVKQPDVGGNAVPSKQSNMGLNASAPFEPVVMGDELSQEQHVELGTGQQQLHLEEQCKIQPEASEQDDVANEMAARDAPQEKNALQEAKTETKLKKPKKKVRMKGGVEVNGERVKLEEDKLKVVAQLPDTSLPVSDCRYLCNAFMLLMLHATYDVSVSLLTCFLPL